MKRLCAALALALALGFLVFAHAAGYPRKRPREGNEPAKTTGLPPAAKVGEAARVTEPAAPGARVAPRGGGHRAGRSRL